MSRTLALLLAGALLVLTAGQAPAQPLPAAAELPQPGTVLASEPMDLALAVPGTTSRAYRLTYVSTDARGARAPSTGAVFLPHGTPPADGWPVVSWAHGTVGLGDTCAPSAKPRSARDASYLATWMEEGYAVVASDYAGLGTPGLMAYLEGRSTAANVVDMVAAGKAFTATLDDRFHLSDRWVVVGQSQGAGAAVQTARYATELDGPLDYRGAVATGTPAYIERLVQHLGPAVPPAPLPGGLNAYVTYLLAGFRWAHPEIPLDTILSPAGRKYLALAETACMSQLVQQLLLVPIGTFFAKPPRSLPGFVDALFDYMEMPESGFDRPFFMGHGLLDTDVPLVTTLPYVQALQANDQPVTWKTYATTHSGTMKASLKDSVPYVRGLFAAG